MTVILRIHLPSRGRSHLDVSPDMLGGGSCLTRRAAAEALRAALTDTVLWERSGRACAGTHVIRRG